MVASRRLSTLFPGSADNSSVLNGLDKSRVMCFRSKRWIFVIPFRFTTPLLFKVFKWTFARASLPPIFLCFTSLFHSFYAYPSTAYCTFSLEFVLYNITCTFTPKETASFSLTCFADSIFTNSYTLSRPPIGQVCWTQI